MNSNRVKSTTGFENQAIMDQKGYDVNNNRGVYTLRNLQYKDAVNASASRYRLQLSGRYVF